MKIPSEDQTPKLDVSNLVLANICPVSNCIENLELLRHSSTVKVKELSINVQGLIGLNYLLVMEPTYIHFFDENIQSIEYMKLILEFINISRSHEDFISRIFSRSVPKFRETGDPFLPFSQMQDQLKESRKYLKVITETLNEFTQWAYLDRAHEPIILDNTLSKLSPENQKRFDAFLRPYLPGTVLMEEYQCRRLLPCWAINEIVPYSESSTLAENNYGELEPNTNTFYFGHGWLRNEQTFKEVQKNLKNAQIDFFQLNLFTDDLSEMIDFSNNSAIYASFLDSNQTPLWQHQLKHLKDALKKSRGSLLLISASGKIQYSEE